MDLKKNSIEQRTSSSKNTSSTVKEIGPEIDALDEV